MRSRLTCLSIAVGVLASSAAAIAVAEQEASPPADRSTPDAEDELGSTPQMGWNTWNVFRCDINEGKIKAAADAIKEHGLDKLGYKYVNIDDCWQAEKRDENNRLQADPGRFPQGIKPVADYVRARGLKLGLYATPGKRTCANIWDDYPGMNGSLGYEELDAQTFVSWGVEYLKYDWCKADEDGVEAESAFRKMRSALDKAVEEAAEKNGGVKRPVFYSIHVEPQRPVDAWRPEVANSWRTTHDIVNKGDKHSWKKMIEIAQINRKLKGYGPQGWNDPDMLDIGNGRLDEAESRTHFSLWSMMAAPLLAGTDLTKATPETLKILRNRDVIAVDQDKLGKQGTVVSGNDNGLVVMSKELADGSYAVTLTNEGKGTATISTTAGAVGLGSAATYSVQDLWSGKRTTTTGSLTAEVAEHDTVMYRVTAEDDGSSVSSTPPSPVSPIPLTPDHGATCTAPPWNRGTAYEHKGLTVSHNGRVWQSKWWTRGNEPGSTYAYGAWADLGAC
ncbi:alpha-galactosidase [Streptomyces sp. M41]|uniref:alpha-galactosidase n=1 Tax=Streptomyces sp. M41 TaxID=3059412 RepID=UPI00374CEE96